VSRIETFPITSLISLMFMKPDLKQELKEEIQKVKNTKGLTRFQREYFLWDLKNDYDTETKKKTSKNYK